MATIRVKSRGKGPRVSGLFERQGQDFYKDIMDRVKRNEKLPINVHHHNSLGDNPRRMQALSTSKDPVLVRAWQELVGKGYKKLGEGSDAVALLKPNGRVLRLCMLYRAPMIEDFIDMASSSPHFPKVFRHGPNGSVYETEMEALTKVTLEERETLDGLLALVRTGTFTNHDSKALEGLFSLKQAMQQVLDVGREMGYSVDINRGRNIMKRGKVFVIVDPFYKRTI